MNTHQFSLTEYYDQQQREQTAINFLAKLLAVKPEDIITALEIIEHHCEETPAYLTFFIPKKSGGKREIKAPVGPVKDLTRKIYRELLLRYPLNYHIHGFRPARSTVTNAKEHLGNNHLVNYDITNCFPSTPIDRIIEVYEWTVGKNLRQEGIPTEIVNTIIEILARLATLRYGRASTEVLPMGSPTSPALLNLVLNSFDIRLSKLLRQKGMEFSYTRYGDDLSISSPNEIPKYVYGIVPSLLGSYGYDINPDKTNFMHRGTSGKPMEVTGLIIGDNHLLLSDRWLKKAATIIERIASMKDPKGKARTTFRGIIGLARMVYDGELPPRLVAALNRVKQGYNKPQQLALLEELFNFTHIPSDESYSPSYQGISTLENIGGLEFDYLPDPTGINDDFFLPEQV